MKAIVAGGRDYCLTLKDALRLAFLLGEHHIDEMVHGNARGVDKAAGRVGLSLGITVTVMPADWDTHGKSAGPLRNKAMAEYIGTTGLLITFDGGTGTADMIRQATVMGIRHIEAWDRRIKEKE